jgi:NADPH:quinone reductase
MPRYGLGWDVVGHVDATGSGTLRFRLGDAVIGLRDLLFAGGAHAEYVVLDESAVAPRTDIGAAHRRGYAAAEWVDGGSRP